MLGRRPVFLTGLAVFVAGSAACGAAPTLTLLIAATLPSVPYEAESTTSSASVFGLSGPQAGQTPPRTPDRSRAPVPRRPSTRIGRPAAKMPTRPAD